MANSRLKRLAIYIRPYWRMVSWGIFSLFVVNAVGVYIPLLIRDSIDQLKSDFNFAELSRYALILFVLSSLMWGIRMFSRISIFGAGRQVEFDLKQKIFQHLLTLEPSYFAKNTIGDLINRATSDVDNVRRLVGFSVLSLANIIFAYSLTLPAMLGINVKLTLAAIAVYPLMIITVKLFSGKLKDSQAAVQESLSDLSELVQEDMSGISLIKIYAQENQERTAFGQRNRKLLAANLRLARIRNLLFPMVEGISYISLLILLGWGSQAITSGEITVGDFVALILFVQGLVFPTALLGFTITVFQRGEVSIDRIDAILHQGAKIKDSEQTLTVKEAIKGKITAKNLTFSYPEAENPALEGLDFSIRAGETIAIVGKIGSGKSTLANAIPRLLDIQPDQLFIDGLDITQMALADLRGAIAYVPQDSFLFSTTIKNNIRYGAPLKETQEIVAAAQQAQIAPEITNFPQQYETMVGERGITLSGGQRQRTSLARALLTNAPILILDDALSSVDNETATRILKNLSPDKQQKTVIFISHQLSAAATADRIFVMDQGRIVQKGSHEELVKEAGLYQALWQQHQLKEELN